ncbi:family 16 glycosylhydrolase [Nakamurella sp. YIM 132087]|uniref:Family 16 glycosylhydrolase n=2 Tax=Nakamurella alba TaxID=2665158 RepID=A0A7K1FRX7_9ACTN|nr:family 16 glycosylhydrolase [Nakamurella alba]
MLGGVNIEDFDGPDLDPTRWLPHYLPAWSSLESTAATYTVADSCLELRIPPMQGLWAHEVHPPLRVSGVQSGNWSGPVGGTRGQQPWQDGLVVREQQETFRGWMPTFGTLTMRARMQLSPRSMASWWMVGFEEDPQECAEICVWEIFGDAVDPGRSAMVGSGLHRFRDPRIAEDFATTRLAIDVARFHEYQVRWTAQEVVFSVDGTEIRRCPGPPVYPMQSMIAVFDFPDRADGTAATDGELVPILQVDRISHAD